ncbi:MAG: 1-phosphofructokinase [Firmicutes bacterium]|nr:1-phosphofructokinase [Bacillota bacterium]
MKPYVVTVTLNPALDKTVVVDKLEVGGLNRVRSARTDPGGKGINVAKVLAGCGVAVKAAGLIAGADGQILQKYLATENITDSFIPISGETRTNLKIVDAGLNITTEINEAGFAVGRIELDAFKDKLMVLLDEACYLVLGGSLPPKVESSIYGELIEMAHSKGVKTVLDADDAALRLGIAAKPFAIKPNLVELENLVGRKLTDDQAVVQAAREITAKGVEIVIVSMGAKGALVMNKKEAYRVSVSPIVPKSTVGAGDSMVGVLVYSLLKQYSLAEMARWVTAAGSATAAKPGTEVCNLAEVEQFLDKVQAERQN